MRNRLAKSSLSLLLLLATVSSSALFWPQLGYAQDAQKQDAEISENSDFLDANSIPTFTGAFLSGQLADSDNDIDQAVAFYKRALEFDPENLEARRRLFDVLLISGDFDEALKLADELQDDAQLSDLAKRALAVDTIRDREYRSTDRFLSLEDLNPIESLINNLLSAWAKFGDNKPEEAIAAVSALEGPEWYSQFKEFNIAMMAISSGDSETAIENLEKLISNESAIQITIDTYLQGLMALAVIHAQNGDKDKALNVLESNANVRVAYPPLDALAKKIRADDELTVPVSNAAQGAAAALYTLGAALNREGNEDIVSLYLQFARSLDPKNAGVLVMLGNLQEQLDRPEKAIAIYESVPETSPMRRLSELQLGLNLADIGETDKALEHIGALIEEHPQDIRAYQSYGRILSSVKRYDEVVENYNKAVKAVGPIHNSGHWNLFYQLGIGYERIKDWDQAEKAFLRSLELSPNQPNVMNYLGYSWIDMNINLEEGMQMIRSAVELRPNDGYIVDSLGWAYYRLGQYEDAVRELERAVELLPSDPTINDHLGDAFWRVGRKSEANFQWRRALPGMADFDASLVPVLELKIKEGLADEDAEKMTKDGSGDTSGDATPAKDG